MPTGLGRLENHKNTHQVFNVGPSSATPVKRHLNDVSLAGRLWPTFICILGFLRNSGTCMRAGPPVIEPSTSWVDPEIPLGRGGVLGEGVLTTLF